MDIINLILVLATFIPAIFGATRFNNDFRNGWEELLLQARTAAKLNSNCDWITYDNLGNGKMYGNPQAYQCPSITVVGGYCILPWSQAITQCNSDTQCAGIALTTNNNWHNAYDKNNEPSVQLNSVSSPLNTNTNTEWYTLKKNCWKFNT